MRSVALNHLRGIEGTVETNERKLKERIKESRTHVG
jgi:hypothetical protein